MRFLKPWRAAIAGNAVVEQWKPYWLAKNQNAVNGYAKPRGWDSGLLRGRLVEIGPLGVDMRERTKLAHGQADEITKLRSHIEQWVAPMVEPRSGRLSSWNFSKD